jgi:signal transduction histidine kinase
MKERAAQFGGSVRLDAAGLRGTRVTIQIPTGTRAEAVSEVAPAASLGIVPANG